MVIREFAEVHSSEWITTIILTPMACDLYKVTRRRSHQTHHETKETKFTATLWCLAVFDHETETTRYLGQQQWKLPYTQYYCHLRSYLLQEIQTT